MTLANETAAPVRHADRFFIGGEWVEPANGGYPVINPATEDVVAEAPEASREQVYEACKAAKAAFPSDGVVVSPAPTMM